MPHPAQHPVTGRLAARLCCRGLPVALLTAVALWSPLSDARGPAEVAPSVDPSLQQPDAYQSEAAADVETLLTDTSKAYLHARARLVAHPDIASVAVLDRLDALPAPTKGERKRLLDVLSELGGGQYVPMFATELRRAVAVAGDKAAAEAAASWLSLLLAQGSAATGELSKLVGDQALPMSVRAAALDALVTATPPAEVGGLAVLVGRGSPTLQGQLTRALSRRVASNDGVRTRLLAATDTAITRAIEASETSGTPQARTASLLQFRAALSHPDDEALSTRLAALAQDARQAFEVRVAAIRGLTRLTTDSARSALLGVAEHALSAPQAGTQSAEILAWLALSGLGEVDAKPVAARHRLHQTSAPRLASLGYALEPLDSDASWLAPSQDNPWPQVRQAALARVEGPCAKATVKLLAKRARPKSDDGDKNPAVARANVQALGRCGEPAFDALAGLLKAGAVDIEQRTEAARQLTKHMGTAGAEVVATVLARDPPRRLARRLVSALRWVSAPTPKVTEALCRTAAVGDAVSPHAVEVLEHLHADPSAACNG